MALAFKTPPTIPNSHRYETDFYAWLIHNSTLIRAGRIAEADLANIAEVLEDIGRSNKTGNQEPPRHAD